MTFSEVGQFPGSLAELIASVTQGRLPTSIRPWKHGRMCFLSGDSAVSDGQHLSLRTKIDDTALPQVYSDG